MFVIVCEFRPQRQHRATTSPLITFQIHLPTLTVDQPYNFVINLEPPTPSYLFWIGIVFTMFPRVHADQITGSGEVVAMIPPSLLLLLPKPTSFPAVLLPYVCRIVWPSKHFPREGRMYVYATLLHALYTKLIVSSVTRRGREIW